MAYLTQYSNSIPVIKYHIDQVLMTIGQDIEMDICVPEDGIAANHAAVEAIKQQADSNYRFIIKSREDESLIQLNGETVTHAEIQDGDWIIIGDIEFQFTDDGVNSIVEQSVTSETSLEQEATKVTENTESEALQLVKELKLELEEEIQEISQEESKEEKTMSTKEFIANSRRSRPRLVF